MENTSLIEKVLVKIKERHEFLLCEKKKIGSQKPKSSSLTTTHGQLDACQLDELIADLDLLMRMLEYEDANECAKCKGDLSPKIEEYCLTTL